MTLDLLLGESFQDWGEIIRALGPAGVLAVVLFFVGKWWREDVKELRGDLKAANEKNDAVQESRVTDMKGVIKDLGGSNA